MDRLEKLPESNADIVALNLVSHVTVDDTISPGEGLAKLFDKMAAMSRDIAGDRRVANADWQEMLKTMDESESKLTVYRQAQAIGDTWAKRWMLCTIAQRLYEELEQDCLNDVAASKIERIQFAEKGMLESWTSRADLKDL